MAGSLPFSIYWNGAYDASGGSNLSYCNQGKFGSIVTHTVADLSDSYLPLSGGKMTGQITKDGQSVTWINGRSGAILRETSVAGYHTLWSLKTTNGSWDFGECSTSGYYNIPLLTYITDTNFSAGTNSFTYQIKFPLDSGTIALTKNIPSALKNPYALTIFGVSYDGSAAKTVGKTDFISTLEEGTSTVTDGTMFVTSYASDNGFADTNAVNYPYKRKASCLYDYIYTKHPFTGTTFYSGNSSNAEHNANNIVKNGHYYYTSNGPTTSIGATTTDGALYAQSYNDSWVGQIAQDYRNGRLFFRGKNNGTWTDWLTNIDSGNYTSYVPTKTGTGASGTWGIDITGSAAKSIPKKDSAHYYPYIGSAYYSTWYKVTLPYTGAAYASSRWMMNSMEIVIGGPYASGYSGRIFLSYYMNHGETAWLAPNVYATAVGNLISGVEIRYQLSDPAVFYIKVANTYSTVSIENLTSNDTASGYDFSRTTIVACAAANVPTSDYKTVSIVALDGKNGTYAYINKPLSVKGATTSTNFVSSVATGTAPVQVTSTTVCSNLNADLADGLHVHTGRNNEANKIVRTDSNGYIQCGWINSTSGEFNTNATVNGVANVPTALNKIYCSEDNFIRYLTPAMFKRAIGLAERVHFGTTDANSGWYKISINSYDAWMLAFTVRLYQNYNYYDICFSGYNYGSNWWYSPQARLLGSTANSIDVKFGHDSTSYHLWVAVPAHNYTGLDIIDCTNGHVQVDNIGNMFTITNESTLSGTIQTELTLKRPALINELDSYVKKSGDTMTGLLTTTSGNKHLGLRVGNTYINAINGNLIFQNNTALRFGGDSWDYNVWAGLKYVHSSKTIYLGLADGTAFTANSAQSGGTLELPGISSIKIANSAISLNIKDSGSTGGLDQLHDGGDTFDFTDKNPKATTYDSTLTGTLTKGASGNYASSFGGKSIASGKRAFAEGTLTIAQGAYSHAEGGDTVTLGEEAHAEGFMSTAVGQASHAEGHSTVAAAIYSHAEGDQTLASGNVSHAEGYLTAATKEYSHAEGMSTVASGATSHAEGDATTAGGMDAHAEGYSSKASGNYSHAEGNTSEAGGLASHAEGYKTKATHPYSHAEGMNTTASGDTSHVEGNLSTASGTDSHAEGYSSTASGATAHAEGANTVASGTKAHAEGYKTTASGAHSHAEGSETKAAGTASHAEGLSTQATDVYDHAEGMNTVASGTVSHAEGNATKAQGADSHAEGKQTTAYAASSHAEGFGSYAGGTYSHAQGYYTKTMNDAEFACGKYNATSSNVLFSVGCGTSNNVRKNALTLKYDSTISKSTLYVENIDVSTAKYLKTCIPMQRNIINPTSAIKSNILYIDASSSYTYIFLFSAVDVEQVGSKITIINDCSKNFSIYSSNSYPTCIHYKNTMPSSVFLLEPYSMCELIVIGKTTTDLSTANSKYCAIITSYASIGNTADNSTNVDRFVLPVVAYGAIVCNNYNTSTGDASLYIRYNLGPNVRYNSTTNRMYVTRANPGVYHLYIPKAWFAYAGDIGISLTCMGFAYDSGNTYLNGNATLKAAVTYIWATTYNELSCWRITIVTSDDATANDLYPNASSTSGYTSSTSEGRIMFILYGLSRNAPYSSAVLGSPKNASGYYYGKS
jgi:hypothetical protein